MTIPRYQELVKQWAKSPPTHIMVMKIAQMLGYEQPNPSAEHAVNKSEAVYYDESYYPDTQQTPHKANAFSALAADFAAAGGTVT